MKKNYVIEYATKETVIIAKWQVSQVKEKWKTNQTYWQLMKTKFKQLGVSSQRCWNTTISLLP